MQNIKLLKKNLITTPEMFEKVLTETENVVLIDDIKPNEKIAKFLKDNTLSLI